MRGHIARKGGRYYVVVDEPTPDGRRKQRWHSGFRTKREAEATLADLVTKINRNTYVSPSRETVAEYLRAWVESVEVRASTKDSYARNLETHVIPTIGTVPLQKLTAQRLDNLYAYWKTEREVPSNGGEPRRAKPLSPRSRRYIATIIGRALAEGVRKGSITTNPARLANPPKAKDTRPRPPKVWEAHELRALLDHVRDDPLYPLWLLLATTGMRRGEGLALRWRDIDLGAGRVSIQRTVISVANKIVESEPKTAKGRRSLSLDAVTLATLTEHRRRQPVVSIDGNDLVFSNEGGPLHPDEVSKAFKRHVRAAGLPPLSVHGLRHTHASICLRAGVHPKVVQERLGHANIAITLDVYSHAIPALQEEAATKVAGLVFGASG